MRIAIALAAAASAGCSSLLGIEDLGLADDARPDAPIDTPPGVICVGGGLLTVCPDPPPAEARVFVGPQELINTDTDPACTLMMSGTREVCVIAYASIEIAAASTLRAIGKRPLALASMSSITIASGGTLDVASYRGKIPGAGGSPADCYAGQPSGDAGGSGGSFGGRGGRGGNNGPDPGAAIAISEIRGGCPGMRGGASGGNPAALAGPGGGAVYLMAREAIVVAGRLNASGAAGEGGGMSQSAGGAGGASGGLIGLDAPSITGGGTIFANGGGGGGSGGFIQTGMPGAESPEAKVEGVGGEGNARGGDGSVGDTLAGAAGESGGGGLVAGGGGGGGAGVIYVRGDLAVSGAISPPVTRP